MGARIPRCVRLPSVVLSSAVVMATGAQAACPVGTDSEFAWPPGAQNDPGGFIVREIRINNNDVFDLDDPDHDAFVHRLMNAAHIQTDEAVIRRQLLFSEGDFVGEGMLLETERYLRENRYLADAEVSPAACDDGMVDIEVTTTDAWSFMPSVSFSRKGGQNFGGFEIHETNLLGSGSELKLSWDSDVDRDLLGVRYADRQLGSSRSGIFLSLEDYDHGYRYFVDLGQPFYSLDTRRSYGIKLDDFDQFDGVFELGDRIADIRHSGLEFTTNYGWSQGLKDGRVTRWFAGLGYDEHDFEHVGDISALRPLPANRRDVYPFFGFEFLEDRYEEATNQDQMARVEDRHLGSRLSVSLGYASTAFGSLEDALRLELAASRGFHLGPRGVMMLSSDLEWREPGSAPSSYVLQADARYYRQRNESRVFFAQLRASAARNPDTDQLLYLGADSGMRGFPVRYVTGDATMLFTLEERLYTDWYPFGLFRVGAAAFVDVGRVWETPGNAEVYSGTLTDAGVGLRIGSPHSATGRMLHIDAAYAFDGPPEAGGWQVYIESRTSF